MASTDVLALPAGTRVESYEIESVMGTGGFGITYAAYDRSLDRRVVLKEYFPAGLAARGSDSMTLTARSENEAETFHYGLKRFLDEARTLAKFHEPSIVRVNRYIEANGTAYFVMDHEEGEPLDQILARERTLDEARIRTLLLPVLCGLRAVHAKRYLHRDIKPSNIFVRRSGMPFLLDFGAARQALEQQTGAMTVMLTPGYAPIEQYSGGEKQGPWSDIYALGATAYHCMTGVAPPVATERIAALHTGEPDPVEHAIAVQDGACSEPFLKALDWMLRLRPEERPQQVEQIIAVLDPNFCETDPTADTQSNPSARTVYYDLDRPRRQALPEPVVQSLEQLLARFAPKVAQRVVRPALERTESFEDLSEFLAGFILTPNDQQAFRRQARAMAGDLGLAGLAPGPDTGSGRPPTGSPSTAFPAGALEQSVLEEAEAELAFFLGPIAKLIVRRMAGRADTREDLYALLADELDDEDERHAFLARAKRRAV